MSRHRRVISGARTRALAGDRAIRGKPVEKPSILPAAAHYADHGPLRPSAGRRYLDGDGGIGAVIARDLNGESLEQRTIALLPGRFFPSTRSPRRASGR